MRVSGKLGEVTEIALNNIRRDYQSKFTMLINKRVAFLKLFLVL